MRQVVLDTETTGLEPSEGHRVIEIGAVELIDRKLTGRHFHHYVNPQRDIEEGALEVHGITLEFLSDKPPFAEVAGAFIDFIDGTELIIHNAPFDLAFLDMELALLPDRPGQVTVFATVLDTLELARELHPGQRCSLDALCKRYAIDDSSRTLHGALRDAEILADVYLAMTGGQSDLGLRFKTAPLHQPDARGIDRSARPALCVLEPSSEELARHRVRLEAIREKSGQCLWLEIEA